MSTHRLPRDPGSAREIRYEVSASSDVVNVSFEKADDELSVSTDPRSALMLASDILNAVNRTAGEEDARETPFEFDR